MTPDDLTVSGGAGGIGADVEDMRRTADLLDGTTTQIGDIASSARGAAISGALLRTTIFSPGSAAAAEGSIIQAAVVVTGLQLGLEWAALELRTRANLFELADAFEEGLDVVVSMAVAPFAIAGLIGVALFTDLPPGAVLSAFPELTDTILGGVVSWAAVLSPIPGLPLDYEGVVGLIRAAAGLVGKFQDTPVSITKVGQPVATTVNGVGDIIGGVADVAAVPAEPDDLSAVRIIRIDHPGGPPTWIVEIPGTDFDGGPTDPSDMGTNLALAHTHDAQLLRTIEAAMAHADIGENDQVLVTGHSQGGLAAMALACDPGVQSRYNITNVVTAGAPVSRFDPPPNVQVLSIEHHQDPVPRTDTQPNPDRPNWTTVTRDVGDQPGVSVDPFAAHDSALYANTANLVDRDPALAAERAELSSFMGPGISTEYELQR